MIRNLKVLGLVLGAVFAMSAMVASAASAQLISDGPVTLKTTETGPEKSNALTAFGLRTECPGSTITGHKYNVTPHGLIASGETTATLTPHYVNCKSIVGGLSLPTTVDMNGCDYVVHIAKGGALTFDIICPVGQEITVTVWTNATDHANAVTPMCILHVKEQKGLAGATASNTATDIDITGTLKNISVTKTKTTHTLLCPAASTTTGEFDIDVTVQGFNGVGGATAISVS